MTRELQASFAFVERNFNLSKRYWGWEVAWLIYSVAGALSVSLIGRSMNNEKLLLTLVIGTIFWSYLAIVFEFIAEAVQWERWEGTLEYTFMAPVRRYAQLLGAAIYAFAFGLVHTIFVLIVLSLFFELDLTSANFTTAIAFTVLEIAGAAGLPLDVTATNAGSSQSGLQAVQLSLATCLWRSRAISQADALNRAHVHQVPGVEVLVRGRTEDVGESLREILTRRADIDGIEMLQRAVRSVLIEKRVTAVRRFAENP